MHADSGYHSAMSRDGIALFDTPIGRCGVGWSERGIAALQLPEASESATRARLTRSLHSGVVDAPLSDVALRACDGVIGLLHGTPTDLTTIPLDMRRVTAFDRQVYAQTRQIGPGSTATYGELAARIGAAGGARAIGRALARNPFAIVVPCHRVLAADGRLGGFSAAGGAAMKLRLLTLESHSSGDLFGSATPLPYDWEAAVAHLRTVDPRLGRIIDAVGPVRLELKPTASVFDALAESIVYQQLSGKAAATILARVRTLFPRPHEGLQPEYLLRTSNARLRGAGLSQAKMLALQDLARRSVAGLIPTLNEIERMDDDAIVEQLGQTRGIGRWTVEMLLIFRLGRPDVLPIDDLGIRKGYAVATNKRELPTPAELVNAGRRWQPYRSAAAWYLWRSSELKPVGSRH
jgi:methylated-DNA-[protein]-cysteine S-methyltransferase